MKQRLGFIPRLILTFFGAYLGFLVGTQGPELIYRGIFAGWKSFHLPDEQRAL